jgi:hypothetical protein
LIPSFAICLHILRLIHPPPETGGEFRFMTFPASFCVIDGKARGTLLSFELFGFFFSRDESMRRGLMDGWMDGLSRGYPGIDCEQEWKEGLLAGWMARESAYVGWKAAS